MENQFKKLMEWSGVGQVNHAETRGKAETPPQCGEEAQTPSRGQRVSAAQWNGLVATT
ncbi:hypothetical protein ACTHAL_001129 [Priestia flexa]|uniref:hypothetical protein n=1 Tax=Priestia flexa TaxID=86664 RepID=UPI001362DC20|nr:hypothetical protein [Priestia flexa]MCG7312042.1 hypothetical protein [Priestia flexa]